MATIPTLALIPSGVKASKVYSVLPTDGTGDFDFTRSGSATRVNSQGLIELVDSNVPRLNYPLIDGVVQGCPSLLLEPTRTNLFLRSEEFENAYWSKGNATVTENTTTAPDGTLTADKLTASTTGTDRRIQRTDSLAAGTYTTSIFVKSAELNTVRMYAVDFSSQATFNLSEGTVSSILGGATANIENYGNGWYRCSITITYSGGSTQTLYLNIGNALGGATINAGDGVFIWGAQLEQGSYATSYIPTQGEISTRVADVCNGAGNSQVINSTEGVLYFEGSALADDGTFRCISISDASNTSNRMFIQYDTTSNFDFILFSGGIGQCSLTTAITQTDNVKIAVKYKTNDFALWVNGIEVATDSDGITFSADTLDKLSFDATASSFPFYGNVKQLQYFNTALSDEELTLLTTL